MNNDNKIMNNRDNKMKEYKEKLYHRTPLKIISFLGQYPQKVFYEREIHKLTNISIGSVNKTLKLLVELDIVEREKKGNLFLYTLNSENSLLKHFKIFENLLLIPDLVKKIKPFAYEIVLYGSCSDGTNTVESDIDIFIKAEEVSKVRKIVNKYRTTYESIKAVILDPLEIASSKKEDAVFYEEVKKGIVLWKGKPKHEKI
jgi:predicted nucleotidyltransferase